jgi:hypothetical protein
MFASEALIGLMFISAGALADQAAADACAAKLSGDRAVVYTAVKAKGPTAANWQNVVKDTVYELNLARKIDVRQANSTVGIDVANCIRLAFQ